MGKSCPKCGSALAEGAAVCSNCGANADDTPEINNSEEISRMLANGEGSVIVNSDELNKEQMEAFNEGKHIEFQDNGLSEEAQQDIAAMDDMNIDQLFEEMGVTFDPHAESEPDQQLPVEKNPDERQPKLELASAPEPVSEAPSPASIPEAVAVEEPAPEPLLKAKKQKAPKKPKPQKKAKKSVDTADDSAPVDLDETHNEPEDHGFIFDPDIHDHDNIVVKAGVTELHRYKIPAKVKKAIFQVCAAIFIFCIGFGICFIIMTDLIPDAVNDIAYDSINATLTKIPAGQEFIPYDVYVKRDVQITECIIFGVLSSGVNDSIPTYYRLLINNNDRTDATFFRPFNVDEYEALRQGSDEDRLRAGHMMNFYESYLRSVKEIDGGSERWSRADMASIIKKLNY